MEHFTIRHIPPDLAQALERESSRLKESLEETVIELLRQALKIRTLGEKSNGLARLAGTWTQEEYERFEEAVAVTEQIDEELWRCRYCLDTSAYSNFKRGDTRVVALVDRAEWLGVSSIALGEIWLRFLGGGRLEQNQADLAEFLSSPLVEELAVDFETGRIYAEMVLSLRRAGTPVPSNDIWIAAAAARAGAPVITYDGHFKFIRQVRSIVLSPPS